MESITLLEWLELARNIATILGAIVIPYAIFQANRNAERRRATAELIKSLTTTPEIVSRMEKLFLYRKHEEDVRLYKDRAKVPDPYEGDINRLIYDHVIVLNFYEAVCTEIKSNAVNFDLVYLASNNTIIGVREVLLERYERYAQGRQEDDYKALIEITRRMITKAINEGQVISPKIPVLNPPKPES